MRLYRNVYDGSVHVHLDGACYRLERPPRGGLRLLVTLVTEPPAEWPPLGPPASSQKECLQQNGDYLDLLAAYHSWSQLLELHVYNLDDAALGWLV